VTAVFVVAESIFLTFRLDGAYDVRSHRWRTPVTQAFANALFDTAAHRALQGSMVRA
jgi:hypothetical protein